ncbi:MAG: WavE lipopolysaccharide synthesis family protein [bacterium]|nr:WavE lipopolysaccharide synthesis family protein [bacterium]
MSKFGLVIQGTLISSGRKTGKSAHMGWRKIPKEDWVEYDCRENIRTVIKEFGHLFESVVISTWKNDVKPDDSFQGATLITSDDETLPKKYRKDQKGQLIPDNRFRQMFSGLAGIEYLEKHSGVDMVVKIRTDQYIDLVSMLEFIKQAQALKRYTPDVIFVPSIMAEDKRYCILDFYFAGSLPIMKAFHASLFEYDAFEFEPSIHRELWLKYAYTAHRSALSMPEYAYFPASYKKAYCEETLQVFQYMVSHVFWPLSFDCFQTIVWRGSPFSKEALESERRNNIFQEAVSEKGIEEISSLLSGGCPRFLGIDWRRYADFRRRFFRKPSSLQEEIFLFYNMTLQITFRFFARLGYFILHPFAFLEGAKRRILRFIQA